MELKYSPEVDILIVKLSDAPVDFAHECDGVITHFSVDGTPAMLEIQGAKEFIIGSMTSLVRGEEVKLP